MTHMEKMQDGKLGLFSFPPNYTGKVAEVVAEYMISHPEAQHNNDPKTKEELREIFNEESENPDEWLEGDKEIWKQMEEGGHDGIVIVGPSNQGTPEWDKLQKIIDDLPDEDKISNDPFARLVAMLDGIVD